MINRSSLEKKVWEKLSEVMDPELDVNIVELGLIYEVRITEKKASGQIVKIVMTLTTPGCPLAGVIDRMIKEAVSELEEIDQSQVETELVWDPPWIQEMMSEEARLRLGML